MTAMPDRTSPAFIAGTGHHTREYQAYRILQLGFVVAPLLAGIDKFFNTMCVWEKYLYQPAASMVGLRPHQFMMLVGVIEILAGIGVACKPKYFAFVVSAWLAGIVVNLLLVSLTSGVVFYDVALRDLGLCLGAFALGRLAYDYDLGMFGGLFVRRSIRTDTTPRAL
jgi:hypothetical protein